MPLKQLLSHPLLYDTLQAIVGSRRARQCLVNEYIRPFPRARILDIGCGPGNMRRFLPEDVYYTGIDSNEMYILAARKEFKGNDRFICSDITDLSHEIISAAEFDIILAIGLLHHLDDEQAKRVFSNSLRQLKNGGRMVTFDNVYVPQQSWIARYIISQDRGRFVRTRDGYSRLMVSSFPRVESFIRNDLMLIPYTHCILRAEKI